MIVQAPLKRGLSPPKAVTGSFSSPAGAVEKDWSKETLRHGFAVPPPFSREVFGGAGGLWYPAGEEEHTKSKNRACRTILRQARRKQTAYLWSTLYI